MSRLRHHQNLQPLLKAQSRSASFSPCSQRIRPVKCTARPTNSERSILVKLQLYIDSNHLSTSLVPYCKTITLLAIRNDCNMPNCALYLNTILIYYRKTKRTRETFLLRQMTEYPPCLLQGTNRMLTHYSGHSIAEVTNLAGIWWNLVNREFDTRLLGCS
ncbi:hypothetical protein KC19_1G024200 [Ceratodon purpureus]|uniref:Uncharacterized protein n=1 Tax=Ceratodon purpureus TaxID=3225 RepID=A0A8T0J374_CERPU|nr:hypothetical protein KC19_1G024200 [Ceratodon purpureus]